MDTNEAITFLARVGIKVDKINKKTFAVWDINGQPWDNGDYRQDRKTGLYLRDKKNEWTGREIIKLARSYMDSNQQTTINKSVKKFSNDKDRTATRDAINVGDFDKIPSKKRAKEEDPWGWD